MIDGIAIPRSWRYNNSMLPRDPEYYTCTYTCPTGIAIRVYFAKEYTSRTCTGNRYCTTPMAWHLVDCGPHW